MIGASWQYYIAGLTESVTRAGEEIAVLLARIEGREA